MIGTGQIRYLVVVLLFMSFFKTNAADLKVQSPAPLFSLQTHEGNTFDLKERQGKWTVLYFYPKADTPGCTKQACAFRDSIKQITSQGAEVFGISADSVEAQAAFHKKHSLNFILLADEKAEVAKLYGTKMPLLNISKRWTFIIDPQLKIAWMETNVDPVKDASVVAEKLNSLK